jgi:hypothetical protein
VAATGVQLRRRADGRSRPSGGCRRHRTRRRRTSEEAVDAVQQRRAGDGQRHHDHAVDRKADQVVPRRLVTRDDEDGRGEAAFAEPVQRLHGRVRLAEVEDDDLDVRARREVLDPLARVLDNVVVVGDAHRQGHGA